MRNDILNTRLSLLHWTPQDLNVKIHAIEPTEDDNSALISFYCFYPGPDVTERIIVGGPGLFNWLLSEETKTAAAGSFIDEVISLSPETNEPVLLSYDEAIPSAIEHLKSNNAKAINFIRDFTRLAIISLAEFSTLDSRLQDLYLDSLILEKRHERPVWANDALKYIYGLSRICPYYSDALRLACNRLFERNAKPGG